MEVCCTKDPRFQPNTTIDDQEFLPRQDGDLTITYDVNRTYESSYWAQVTIENHNPLGRLDNWQLSWDWMEDEFIFTMRGAYPSVVDTSDCIFGPQGQYYQQLDFSTALNCDRRPTIVDPPLHDQQHQPRNGPLLLPQRTILPPAMDPSKSKSSFQINVFKMPPNTNRSYLTPAPELGHRRPSEPGPTSAGPRPGQPVPLPRPERPALQHILGRQLAGRLQHHAAKGCEPPLLRLVLGLLQ
ncbi:cobra-like protein 7 [Phtheirospermum japonicum]|uniref:Cobra-like protein 7 n=1 Tax=Phtheirospermum japonicum TaxID=374723 RepID=A0A830D486_9LAMI|nr:cobra-like protein 7 [Phtheirospermum japonicum]